MENDGWIKLYRKLNKNQVLQDAVAWQIFTWLLLNVDRKTGKYNTGRIYISRELKINESTCYKAIKRLEKKYKMVTLVGNNKFTTFFIYNWFKYQGDGNSSGNNKVTTKEQQSNNKVTLNKKREVRIKNIIADKQQSSWIRKPIEKQTQLQRLGYFLEDTLNTKITNWGKQAKALSMMVKAGYTEEQIKKTIIYMATQDDFFADKGFDLMTVSNQISRYKAEFEKRKGG